MMNISHGLKFFSTVSVLKLVGYFFALLLLPIVAIAKAASPFNIIYTDSANRYVYVSDFLGNHILDYSHAGYMGADKPIPSLTGLPVFPVPNSNDPSCANGTTNFTTCIQNAINAAAANYASTGVMSVVQIAAGNYPIMVPATPGTSLLTVASSGVVLAGAGSGQTTITVNGTAPFAKGKELAVIGAGGTNPATVIWAAPTAPTAKIANTFVPAGSTEFRVTPASSNGYIPKVGDNMIIGVPTQNYWSSFTNYGGIGSGGTLPPSTTAAWWGVGSVGPINSTYNQMYATTQFSDIRYNRVVTSVVNLGNNTYGVSVNAPIFAAINNGNPSPTGQALDAAPYVYPFDANASGYLNNIGIQGLAVNIGFFSGSATNNNQQEYATIGISFTQANDVWVDDVKVSGYRTNGFTTRSVNQATISNSQAINVNTNFANGPSFNGGFGFSAQNGSSNILFSNCSAAMPSQGFAQNSPATSGIVVLNSNTSKNYLESGGHQKWSQGILFDHLAITNDLGQWSSASFGNRSTAGSSHGWSSINSVMWGLSLDSTAKVNVQQPPQGQNYFMSYTLGQPSSAVVTGQGLCNGNNPCVQPSGNAGYFETKTTASNTSLPSLYLTQLSERQKAGGLPPSAPASLKVTFATNKATLTWDNLMGAGQGVKNFGIERSVDGGQTFTLLTATVPATATSYVDSSRGVTSTSVYRIYALKDITNSNNVITSARSPYSNAAPIVARYIKLVTYTSNTTLNGGKVNLNQFQVNSGTAPASVFTYNNSNNSYTKTTLSGSTGVCRNNNVACAFDGKTTTYYATNGAPWINANGRPTNNQQNFYVDMNGLITLNQLILNFGNPFSPEYYIYVSSNGTTWTKVYGTIFGTTGANTITF